MVAIELGHSRIIKFIRCLFMSKLTNIFICLGKDGIEFKEIDLRTMEIREISSGKDSMLA